MAFLDEGARVAARSRKRTMLGPDGYRQRVEILRRRFACGTFAAQLAVQGEAVRRGEIAP